MSAIPNETDGATGGTRMGTFDYRVLEGWPPLSWVVRWRTPKPGSRSNFTVCCGAQVERRETWFGECIWAGDFAEGAFHKTEAVFGSGARITGSEVVFVGAGSTVDRLHTYECGEVKAVSNSLIGLCAVCDVDLDPYHAGYYSDFHTINRGLGRYKALLRTRGGDVTIVYHDNIHWDGKRLTLVAKAHSGVEFRRFKDYTDYLESQVGALIRNAQDPGRSKPFKPLATLSNGYDSTAVCSMASAVGLRECLGFIEGYPTSAEDLKEVARALGIRLDLRRRETTQRDDAEAVALFLASGTVGYESHFLQIEPELVSTLLFTGFHGDLVWGLSHGHQNVLQRAGPSGLSLTEYRLHVPFVHAPLPFLGARQLEELTAIGRSAEMAPWRVGGEYDRPIARRFAEERGVPRDSFGKRKYIASIALHSCQTVSDGVQAEMSEWIHSRWHQGVPLRYRLSLASRSSRNLGASILSRTGRQPTGSPVARLKGALRGRLKEYPLFRYTFPWAVAKIARRYSESFQATASAERFRSGE